MTEGVVKYEIDHTDAEAVDSPALTKLCNWRDALYCLGLVGQDSERYGGYGYGNVSVRCGNSFLVSGTQTGGIQNLKPEHFAVVESWDPRKNFIKSRGPIKPSSEALTHAAIYSHAPPETQYVVHVHSPIIWQTARVDNSLPSIDESIPYGTPEMAAAVGELFTEGKLKTADVILMLGHEDGLVAFGRTAAEASSIIMYMLMVSGE